MEFSKFEQQVFLTTVKIRNLTDGEFGTGFIIKKPVADDKEQILLFSNKHVIWGMKNQNTSDVLRTLEITMHRYEDDGTHILGTTHTFRMDVNHNSPGYSEHPDKNIDVACINISEVTAVGIPVNYRAIDVKNFFNFERSEINSGEKVIFIGYPTGLYDEKNSLPIMRSGTIASIPSVDFNGLPQILIDAQVFPGSSGSPVFTTLNGHYKFLGIISQSYFKNLDFAEIEITSDSQTFKVPKEYIGLGLLFTNETIKTVYDSVIYKP